MKKSYSEITPYLEEMAKQSSEHNGILPQMYEQYHVFRGLRDINGNGVVTGLTEVSRIKAKEKTPDGEEVPCEGQLYYRGINVRNLVDGFLKDKRFGFEETVYLLLFSELPNKTQLQGAVGVPEPARVVCAGYDPQGTGERHDEHSVTHSAGAVCL